MIIYSINASPRKNWNDAQLLMKFKNGFLSVLPDTDYREINLYDLNYKGCYSCFGCKLKSLENIRCVVKDDIYDILYNIRHCNGFVYASPIYFSDANGELKSFFERLMYPGPVESQIPIYAIYTMNADEEKLEKVIRPALNTIKKSLRQNFKVDVEEFFAFKTLQRNNQELYRPSSHTNPQERIERHETQWPIDLQSAYEAGIKFANKILTNK